MTEQRISRPLEIGPLDDGFHFGSMSDRWWETETCWFSFHNAERALGGWLYVMARPNVGAVAGGCWVWDPTACLPWEVLYNANYTCQRLPEQTDLRDATFTTGVSVRVLEPLQRYAIGYQDGERIRLSLEFEAVMPPVPLHSSASGFGTLGHFDQFGRVRGELVLHGESIPIDCLSMRDRSWGPRPEHRPRRTAYVTGISDEANGFLAVSDPSKPDSPVEHGFLLRQGEIQPLVKGTRKADYDPRQGWMRSIRIEGVDAAGRTLVASGRPTSRMIINRHTFIDVNSLVQWDIGGNEGWGEDQDCWPVHAWSDRMRRQSGEDAC